MWSATLIYPLTFIVAFVGLIAWTFLADQKNHSKVFRTLFFLGFLGWCLALWSANGEATFKLSIAFRDLIVLGLASFVIGSAKSNRIVGLAAVILSGLFVKQYYYPILKSTFASQIVELDQAGEWIIEVAPDVDVSDLARDLQLIDASLQPAFNVQDPASTELDDCFIVDLADEANGKFREVRTYLDEAPEVDWVEENEWLQIDPQPTATSALRSQPIGINDPRAIDQWSFEALQIPELHQKLTGVTFQKKALVAILDTGVDGNHEDLKTNYRSIDPGSDRDGNGHGTHVAGIVAATTNNRVGIASMIGTDALINITGVKVLSDMGFGSQAKIIQGMLLAADAGADVISMSLGGPSNDKKQRAYAEAVQYCQKKGAIVIVAAGNAAVNASTYAPANTPGVIAVSAVNSALKQTSFTNGVQDLDYGIAAPGEDILSTFPKNQYRSFKGTSMAAPHVSSLVGILKSIEPGLSTQEVFAILTESGINSNHTAKTGKIIQPAAALDLIHVPAL